jgi:NAD(P)-dependent dehydrogenase (short-subunit alcohol dehydrogenase family)
MQVLRDRVAVITGAASGIGRGLARRCAQEGMKVALADIEPTALAETETELRAMGVPVVSIVTDVAKVQEVEALAQKTLETFGAAHLLCNNAGVGVIRSVWESTLADWKWVLGVNLWGVIHGLHIFVPIMLEQDTECHIVNTASIAGLVVAPGSSSTYNVSKHGVVALSETLYYELAQRAPKVKVSVLCPGWVNTRIVDSERNRPIELRNDRLALPVGPEDEAIMQAARQAIQEGISPDQVAECVFRAIRKEQLYIFTHPETKDWVRTHMEYMLAERNPPLDPAQPETHQR